MENTIPEPIQRIAEKQSRIFYWQVYRFGNRCLDIEDFTQTIYEKLWKDGLWSCVDHTMIYIVARRACMDHCRSMIKGYKQKKQFTMVEYEEQLCKVFNNQYYEIESLKQLMSKLSPTKKMILDWIREGHTLKQIGEMVNLTESRISQIRTEIVNRLHRLYIKKPFRKPIPQRQAKIIPFENYARPPKRHCSKQGCHLPHYGKGKCKKHYMREYMRGYSARKRLVSQR